MVSFNSKEKNRIFLKAKSRKLDVLIIGYEAFRKAFNEINEIDWECYIFDEVSERLNSEVTMDSAVQFVMKLERTTNQISWNSIEGFPFDSLLMFLGSSN